MAISQNPLTGQILLINKIPGYQIKLMVGYFYMEMNNHQVATDWQM